MVAIITHGFNHFPIIF
ncbi:TPA: CRISPR-associated DxTHG motif protein [Haemophilus influenzae]